MGNTYSYRCKRCGYEESFNHGEGRFVHSQSLTEYLQQPVKIFHHKTHNLLTKLAKSKADLFVKAAFEIYKCHRCKVLYDKVEVTVYDEGRRLHRSEFRCNKCNSRLKRTNIHRLKKATCPVCQNEAFHIGNFQNKLWS